MKYRPDDRADRIRAINDTFRRTFVGGKVMVSRGVMELGMPAVADILDRVRHHDHFSADNDPYGEHDFGVIEYGQRRV